MTIYPALCRRCHQAPAQAHRRRGRVDLAYCRDCSTASVRASRQRSCESRAEWLAKLEQWRHQ